MKRGSVVGPGALVLASLEIVAPTFIFLRCALGALGVALLLRAAPAWLAGALPLNLVIFALLSLLTCPSAFKSDPI